MHFVQCDELNLIVIIHRKTLDCISLLLTGLWAMWGVEGGGPARADPRLVMAGATGWVGEHVRRLVEASRPRLLAAHRGDAAVLDATFEWAARMQCSIDGCGDLLSATADRRMRILQPSSPSSVGRWGAGCKWEVTLF